QINAATITTADNYLTAGSIETGRFGEAAVNLTDAIKLAHGTPAAENVCSSFGYVWMHTRSAPSITSNQQDYILPDKAIQVANCAVTGMKFHDVNGDGSRQAATEAYLGGWTMYADYDGDGALDNDKDGVAEAGEEPYDITSNGTTDPRPLGTYLIAGIKPGTWTIREEGQPGWSCTAPASCTYSVVMDGTLKSGKDFGNWRRPRVKVAKVTQSTPADTTTPFAFTSGLPAQTSFSLAGGQDTGFVNAEAGSLTITEGSLAGTDFDFANAACTGTDSGATAPSYSGQSATVHLQSGDEITCTFTNTKRGTASGIKYHDRNGDGDQDAGEDGLAGFQIYADANANNAHDAGEPISAATAASGQWALSGLVPGTHTLRETGPSGWSCTDPAPGDGAPASTSAA
ncbi:MAG: SdrD B-like domain-containing protein, partial [Actinomycetes bacterium]